MSLSKRAFYTLFFIIITEGYVVLSSELLAIRVTIPFIGSGTDVVSVIIAAVLLPLSFGYYYGGKFKPYKNKHGHVVGVREKLTRNILLSTIFLVFGLSYVPLISFMEGLINLGIGHRIALTTIYSGLFLVTPVFLLGQTIPLVSNYFSKEKLSQITGKILFVSTIGSFLGAVFSTLVLMATIGVHYTVSLNFILLGVLYFTIQRREPIWKKSFITLLIVIGIAFNAGPLLKRFHVVENNQYNVIQVFENPGNDIRIISLNHNSDSKYSPTTQTKHNYINFIEVQYLYSRDAESKPLNVLVLGAGGFTFGADEAINTYHYVDIDPTLKKVAEEHFLRKPLAANQIFHPVSAESFLIDGDEKFDLIFLDAYQGDLTIPENLVTQDFFRRVKSRLSDDGVVVANFIVNPSLGNAFARNLDNTFRSVFPLVSRQVIGSYNGWDKDQTRNVIYSYARSDEENNLKIYTDNKNTVYYDKPKERKRN